MIQTDSLKQVPLRFAREWEDLFNLPQLTSVGLRVLAALGVGWIAFRALKLVLRRIEAALDDPEAASLPAHVQRTRTMISLVRSVGRVVITVLVLFMVLGALGVDLGPLLAGAGVVGLAFSFGAQSLVKDIISGLFILVENQYGVGDVVRIADVSGAVERMTLRVVVLRDTHGAVHIIPNGEIKRVTNLTRSWSRAVIDVKVDYRQDPDRVIGILRGIGTALHADAAWTALLVEEPSVPGIEALTETGMVIRMMAKTLPMKQWDVARELRRRIKLRFDEEGVDIPVTGVTVNVGDPGHAPPRERAPQPQQGPAPPEDA
jgi:small conductance mechanosensitive channel